MKFIIVLYFVVVLEFVNGQNSCKIIAQGVKEAQKRFIVNEHNRLRSFNQKVLNKDNSNLVKLKWDDCLAQKAQEYVGSCNTDYTNQSVCYKTFSQNIFKRNVRSRSLWLNALISWFTEYRLSVHDIFHVHHEHHQEFHNFEIIWTKANRIGCGFALLKKQQFENVYLCNYGFADDSTNSTIEISTISPKIPDEETMTTQEDSEESKESDLVTTDIIKDDSANSAEEFSTISPQIPYGETIIIQKDNEESKESKERTESKKSTKIKFLESEERDEGEEAVPNHSVEAN